MHSGTLISSKSYCNVLRLVKYSIVDVSYTRYCCGINHDTHYNNCNLLLICEQREEQ